MKRGFSLIELLLAMAIGSIVMGAVIIAIFGDQSTVLSSETDAGATGLAQQQIEQAQAAARQDFALVNTAATTTDGIYSKWTDVQLSSDHLTKSVTSYVYWIGEKGQKLMTKIVTLVTDIDDANSPNSCNSSLSGNWGNPVVMNPSHAVDIDPDQITGVAVFGNTAYITGYHSGNKPDFFTVDVTDPTNPILKYSLEVDNSLGDTGLNGVAIASTSNKVYAFVAHRSTGTNGQLMVIDVTDPANPVYKNKITVTGAGGIGNTVFYHNKMLYLGLTANGTDPVFVMYDATDPLSLVRKGSFTLNSHDVNSIFVKNNFAYVASPDSEELKVYDVSNPNSPSFVGGSGTLPDSTANGESVYVVGDTAYLGRAVGLGGSTKQLYAFNVANRSVDPYPVLGTPVAVGESINGIMIRSNYAFTTSNSKFQVWNMASPGIFSALGYIDITGVNGSPPGNIACNNNLFYIGVTGPSGGSGHDVLKIIGPGPQIALTSGGDVSVVQGSSGNTSVTATLSSGTATPVTVSAAGLPAGATVSYTNNGCTPTCMIQISVATTFPTTPVGTYPITVSAAGVSTTFNLTVTTQPFDYSMSNPTNVSVAQGTQGTSTLTMTRTSGTASPVTLGVSGLPAGTTLTYVNGTCSPNCSPQIGIQTSAATPIGSYTITVSGTPGGVSNPTKTFTLTVTTAPFNYSLAASPSSLVFTRTTPGTETITVTRLGLGVAQPVTVTLSGFPSNVSGAPASQTCTPTASTCTVTFTISISSSAHRTGTITVTGSPLGKTTTFGIVAN